MIVASKYTVFPHKKGGFYIVNNEKPTCPDCNGSMTVRGSVKRIVKDSDAIDYTFRLRRLRCLTCNKIHTEIPDLMLPHKHYSRKTIEQYLREKADCAADNKTLYRWRKER